MVFSIFVLPVIFTIAIAQQIPTNSTSVSEKIVGGTDIDLSKAPYAVSLHLFGSRFWCGGVLISEKFVLTAAHCTESGWLKVRIGSSKNSKEGVFVKVEKAQRHPKYNRNSFDFDFALLEIKLSEKLPKKAAFAKLPKKNVNLKDGEKCFAVGWGKTENPQEKVEQLKGVELPIIGLEVCRKSYGESITEQMICAGFPNGGFDSCNGDSGGALVRVSDKLLVGITSWGNGCAQAGYPGVYARVSAARSWISDITGV